jgi:phosphoribosyl-AMP cyclohydrolase / phosphoribosyl-ATP pyrophosphohydrolase
MNAGNVSALTLTDVENLDFTKSGGLLPAIIQDANTGTVLMLGYMNREALETTLKRQRVVFFSRSKNRLWEKGETSGHRLRLVAAHADCDRDALLVTAQPEGPTCHLGSDSCFASAAAVGGGPAFLGELERVVASRLSTDAEGSYTARLARQGSRRIAQKVAEEGVEVALAAAAGSNEELTAEAADLIYHLIVLLKTRDLSLAQVAQELRDRHNARA